MATALHVKARLIPWDDRAFVEAFERSHAEVVTSGCCPEGPAAAARVQAMLRAGGYPRAWIRVERSVDEALEHVAHWTIIRDGI